MVERHADEAAFLWERRERACRSPLFDRGALAEIDERLAANLEGLVLAREVGIEKSLSAVAPGRPGELFTAVHVAAELGDAMALARLLVLAGKDPAGARAVVSALGWLSPERADRTLTELLADECPPSLQRLGIAGCAVRRRDPGDALARALRSPDAALRARACRAVGELGRRDLVPALRAELLGGGDEVEPWAAWSAVLLGEAGALPALWRAAEGGGGAAVAACDLAARHGGAAEAVARIEALAGAPGGLPAAVAGAAARGDAACVPLLLGVIDGRPELSRRAAWAYATITGARLEPPLAVRVPTNDPPDDRIARLVADPFEDLPTPDGAALRAHWDGVRAGLQAGERRLGGRAIEPAWLAECLRAGAQPWRASAAVEIARTSARGGLFPVRAPARIQAAGLARLPDPG